MLSQFEFKVVDPYQENQEKPIHDWIREAVFFIGGSWYCNRGDLLTLEEVSANLRLRWFMGNGITKIAVEPVESAGHWLGYYSIGQLDPFTFSCFTHNYTPSLEDFNRIEEMVRVYLPQIEIVHCTHCLNRFGNELTESGWRCPICLEHFSHKVQDRAGFVYIFGSVENGYYKIGCGSNPMARLRDYQPSKLPFPVEMIHVIPVDDKLKAEAELHRLYREQRTNGEWFKLSEADLSRIKGLSRYVGGHWSTVDPTPAYGGAR